MLQGDVLPEEFPAFSDLLRRLYAVSPFRNRRSIGGRVSDVRVGLP